MSEEEGQKGRGPEAISIIIHRARFLKGSKGDSLSSMVKAEFAFNQLGESAKVDSNIDSAAEYNFTTNFDCVFDGGQCLDDIAHKPVLITITEVLPKEKKQKEEKTAPLGQCTLDLLPLIQGESKFTKVLYVNTLPGSALELLPPDSDKPELDVTVSVNKPLLSGQHLEQSNMARVTVESVYSLPDVWNSSPANYTYTVTLPLPLTDEKETIVVYPNGCVKPANEKDAQNKQKKWPYVPNAQGNSGFIQDNFVASGPIDEEDGELKDKDDVEFRNDAETAKNRIVFNTERRCYLEPSAVRTMQSKIALTRYWPVEIIRQQIPQQGKGAKKEEEGAYSYHGVAYVNLAKLLYPGLRHVRGAFRVYGFNEHEVFEKTKRKGGVADEAVRIASSINRNSPYGKKEGAPAAAKEKVKDAKEAGKKASTAIKIGEAASESEVVPPHNPEAQHLLDAKTYIVIDIEVERPLIPKREPEFLAMKVAEYIPPRPKFPRRATGADKAVEDYHTDIVSVGKLLLEEYRELFGEQLRNQPPEETRDGVQTRFNELIYELNRSGRYFSFKEQLKHAVVKLVREKYLKTTNFQSREELQAFLSDLYVYLIDQMHVGVAQVFTPKDQTPIPEPLTDSQQLKHFAREAEVNENFDLAARYYQERLARNKKDADHWFDYATFSLLIGDTEKAEECVKQTIALDQQHIRGLVLYGLLSSMQESYDVAEIFLETATSIEPDNVVCWTVLGLFYDGVNNDIGAEMAFMEADDLNRAAAAGVPATAAAEDEEAPAEDEENKPEKQPEDLVEQQGAPSEKVVSGKDVSGKDEPAPASLTGGQPNEIESTSNLNVAKTADAQSRDRLASPLPVSRRGSVKPSKGPSPPGSPAEEQPPRPETPQPEKSIFMLTAEYLLEIKAMQFTERALSHELLSPSGGPSTPYYIALARLKLQKREFNECEEALREALQAEFQNGDAWAIQGHVKYLQGDMLEAKVCYERVMSFMTPAEEMHAVYLRLASIYLQEGQFDDAKKTFLQACRDSPSCVSWLGVGISCYRLEELTEAEDALCEANILNNKDSEVWGYLSLVCLKTARKLEAEQAYKYALKVGLCDTLLLDEIHLTQAEVGFGNPEF